MTKTLLGPPTPEVKAFPIDFQAGPFEKLIKQIQQSGKSQDNGSRQADRKAEKVNEGKKEAAQKKKDRKTNLPPTNWLDDCDVFWLPRFPMKRLGGAEGGEKYGVSDIGRLGKENNQAIDPQTHSACRRHSVFKREEEIFVQFLRFFPHLLHKGFPLNEWIILLGIGRQSPVR